MNRNKFYHMPNSRFYRPISTVREILRCPQVEIHVEEYENILIGYDLAKSKFDRIREYLDNEQYSQSDKIIILKENHPTYFGKGQTHIIKDYIESLKIYNDPFNLTIEYEKSIKEIKEAQSLLDLYFNQIIENYSPSPKTDKIRDTLIRHDFLKLSKTEKLDSQQRSNLFSMIFQNKAPYLIALLEYLDFFHYLFHTLFLNDKKEKTWILISEIVGKSKKEVEMNYNSLYKNFKGDKVRYKAHQYSQQVRIDFESKILVQN